MKRRTRLIRQEIFGLEISSLKVFALEMDIHQDTKAANKSNNQTFSDISMAGSFSGDVLHIDMSRHTFQSSFTCIL